MSDDLQQRVIDLVLYAGALEKQVAVLTVERESLHRELALTQQFLEALKQ